MTLGKASDSTVLGAEISRSGRAVVAWTTQDLGEERDQPHVIRAATREPGHVFARARTVDSGGGVVEQDQYAHDPRSGLRLAVGDDGRALLQWGALSETSKYHYDHPIRLASASPHGRFGHWRTLAAEGYPGDVALRRDGTPLAVWYADGPRASVTWHRADDPRPGQALRGRLRRLALRRPGRGRLGGRLRRGREPVSRRPQVRTSRERRRGRGTQPRRRPHPRPIHAEKGPGPFSGRLRKWGQALFRFAPRPRPAGRRAAGRGVGVWGGRLRAGRASRPPPKRRRRARRSARGGRRPRGRDGVCGVRWP